MPKIEGLQKVIAALRAKAAKIPRENPSVIVGYTASYSLYVHEDLEAYHKVGQAKFLEQPAREMQEELGQIVIKALQDK